MQDLPHRYPVSAFAEGANNLTVSSPGIPDLEMAGPPEFGGPGDVWSPETQLVGAVASCFILTFRAVARAARLEWQSLSCHAVGILDKVDRVTQFTDFEIRAELEVPLGTSEEKALRLMEKAEKHCLITNSMKAKSTLDATVRVVDVAADASL